MSDKNNPEETKADNEELQEDPAINILKEEVADLNDRLLRSTAEAENMRKRYEKQILDTKNYAVNDFAKDLLSVADNLSRALEYKPEEMSQEVKNILQGVEMTRQEMRNIFSKYKMTEITPSIGEKFDYNLHYAVTQVPDSSHPEGTILELVQVGYMIGQRLLRPATVTVTKTPE